MTTQDSAIVPDDPIVERADPPRKADAQHRTDQRVRGRNRKAHAARHPDRDRGGEGRGIAAAGREFGDAFTHRRHDAVAQRRQAEDDSGASQKQEPGRNRGGALDDPGLGVQHRGDGRDRVRHVVRAVRERDRAGAQDLEPAEHALDGREVEVPLGLRVHTDPVDEEPRDRGTDEPEPAGERQRGWQAEVEADDS